MQFVGKPLSSAGIAQAVELTTANIDNPTELNALGTAVPDWRLVHTNIAGSDQATLYRLDTSSDAVSAPYIMASATVGLRWVAIAGYATNQAVQLASTLAVTGIVTASNTTDSTSVGTGGLLASGGVGVTKQLTVGSNAAVGGTFDPFGRGYTRCLTVTASAFTGSAGVEVEAGTGQAAQFDMGVAGTRYGSITCNTSGFSFSAFSTAAFNLAVAGTTWLQIATTGLAHWFSTQEATSVANASIFTDGGLGVAKRSFLGTIGSTFKGNMMAGVQDGTGTNSGQVGEVLTGTTSAYTNYTATATNQQVVTLSLTAGDWMVQWFGTISGAGATLTTTANALFALSTTTASTTGTTEGLGDLAYVSQTFNAASGRVSTSGFKRINIATTTSYFLNSQATFTGGNPQFVGSIVATRIR